MLDRSFVASFSAASRTADSSGSGVDAGAVTVFVSDMVLSPGSKTAGGYCAAKILGGRYWQSQRNNTDTKTRSSTTRTSSKQLIGRSTLLRFQPRDADAELWGQGIRACPLFAG